MRREKKRLTYPVHCKEGIDLLVQSMEMVEDSTVDTKIFALLSDGIRGRNRGLFKLVTR